MTSGRKVLFVLRPTRLPDRLRQAMDIPAGSGFSAVDGRCQLTVEPAEPDSAQAAEV